jgi:flagellar motor protein MotB
MSIQTAKQLQQSEIFFVLFLLIVVATIVLWADAEKNKPPTAGSATPPRKPPIITLPEASGYRFESGSAELSDEFQTKLVSRIIPLLQAIADTFHVDVIEVIGHTDGQIVRMGGRAGNLDFILEDVASSLNPNELSSLIPYSNADLGLMRALAIIKFIKANASAWVESKQIAFRPYSAAQLLMPDGSFANVDRDPDAERRRIEIRFTRLSEKR